MFKWNYEQHLYTHTLIPIIYRFASTNEPLSSHDNLYYIHFYILFLKLANDLEMVTSYIGITVQVMTIQKFLVLVFDTKIGR